MTTYISIYLFIFFIFISNFHFNKVINSFVILFICTIYIFLIGFRYEVGGDWINYKYMYENTFLLKIFFNSLKNFNFANALVYINQINFSFDILTSLSRVLQIGLPGLNFLNSFILIFGLYFFAKNKKNTLLILLISFPILVVIVGMGYTRQASALGLIFITITYLEKGKIGKSLIFIILAITFHKTSLIFLLIYLFYVKKINVLLIFISIPILLLVYLLYFETQISHIVYNYLGDGNNFISIGAVPRTFLFLMSAIIFMYRPKNFIENSHHHLKLYSSISLIIIFMFPFVLIFSTALDRILIYFFSIQLLVFSQLDSFSNSKKIKYIINLLICLFYFLILVVWLIYGRFSNHWIPYQNYYL